LAPAVIAEQVLHGQAERRNNALRSAAVPTLEQNLAVIFSECQVATPACVIVRGTPAPKVLPIPSDGTA
jgi:hypothetical protein